MSDLKEGEGDVGSLYIPAQKAVCQVFLQRGSIKLMEALEEVLT